LYCKNNSVGETEPTASLVDRLFSFQSEDFPDELNLPNDITLRQPPHLAFPDHVQNLVALNRSPRSIERSKILAGVHPTLDPSMVLFHNICLNTGRFDSGIAAPFSARASVVARARSCIMSIAQLNWFDGICQPFFFRRLKTPPDLIQPLSLAL
jgi:hypothetical protein